MKFFRQWGRKDLWNLVMRALIKGKGWEFLKLWIESLSHGSGNRQFCSDTQIKQLVVRVYLWDKYLAIKHSKLAKWQINLTFTCCTIIWHLLTFSFHKRTFSNATIFSFTDICSCKLNSKQILRQEDQPSQKTERYSILLIVIAYRKRQKVVRLSKTHGDVAFIDCLLSFLLYPVLTLNDIKNIFKTKKNYMKFHIELQHNIQHFARASCSKNDKTNHRKLSACKHCMLTTWLQYLGRS